MGVPIAVLLASSLSVVRTPEYVSLVPESTRFIAAGEDVPLDIVVTADEPINTIAGTFVSAHPSVSVVAVETDQSVIDLWQTPPQVEAHKVPFAGGTLAEGGLVGSAVALRVHVVASEPGRYTVGIADATLLAHDGRGTPLSVSSAPLTLIVRTAERPSPDVNGDRVVNLFDFGIVSGRVFRTYEAKYDLNHDGKISLTDVAIIINTMADDSRLGSFALLF